MSLTNDDQAKQAFRSATKLRDAGRHDDALAILHDLLSAYPDSPAVLGTIAGVLYDARRLGEAREYFARVLKLRPNNELASLGLFHCLWGLDDRASARAEVVRFLSENSSEEYRLLLDEMGWEFDSLGQRLTEG